MNLFRSAALNARVLLTAPVREVRNRWMQKQLASPMFVPFYHRVADTHPNDWTISCHQFERHVNYCESRFDLIGLDELQRRVEQKDSPRPSVTFSFDDGYAENCDFALPLLAERGIPCIYFVAIDHLQRQIPFPHDCEAGVPLAVNTLTQLREIAAMGIEIGLHTRNHVDFSKVTDQRTVHHEITNAKQELEQMIGSRVRYFAFPYGLPAQLTRVAIDAVYESGMEGFCSAFGGYNTVGRDSFHIRRFHGDTCFARLQNWLSFDPEKLRREPAIDYRIGHGASAREFGRVNSEALPV
ncbi:polysaccharide deacetylase family protein [Novipirellula artificiosorum]|uniref:Polysaccharide deacetylase n=1 Tax=Novipirellula artificiosorum TaxID=2528016 RepID=A0A5C6DIE8_9BACT|nr:polysaccharide deacetylase family protein [Novipirellula artificiosorum]TWU37143.1 Polysaccharide deacetylase [Novipirellula artificiosorum]